MKKYAAQIPCEILYRPMDPRFAESIRRFQGVPTIAVSPGGRIFLGWYAGGTTEPHIDNYNLLVCSDDGGRTWSRPLMVIPSDRERMIHAYEIQLWTDPRGRLRLYWVQNDAEPGEDASPVWAPRHPEVVVDGVLFNDFRHSMWEMVCEDPDAGEPLFSPPRCLDIGILRCKPLALSDGRWLYFNYDQLHDSYGYSISADEGRTRVHGYGAGVIDTNFDEAMAYEKKNGEIRMLARCTLGELAESSSFDGGRTWSPARLSGIPAADSRFFVSCTPSGRIMLIRNASPKGRSHMTVSLSEDEGETWFCNRVIDTREGISYPDADFWGGRVFVTYDRERTGAREILFVSFTEEDIMDPSAAIRPVVLSKP
ncbi:MAG: exo-alpha-sialidase [Abditibacteriota bacterium]|nr:exo-alpha-sialidase [Abditibacteriota bacterium]